MTRGGVKISQKVEQELVITCVECTGDGCCDLKGSIALPYPSHTCKRVEEFLGWRACMFLVRETLSIKESEVSTIAPSTLHPRVWG